MVELAGRLAARSPGQKASPLAVLDAGCGNGRLARALAGAGIACHYTGLDADAGLLLAGAEQTQGLPGLSVRFAQVDMARAGWLDELGAQSSAPAGESTGPMAATALQPARQVFDVVACLAVLHHFPGLNLRARIVQELASLLAPGGMLALSTWQFLSSERLAQKQVEWDAVGVDIADIEPGDALLPWNQGTHALRYVHQLDLPELQALAAAAGLTLAAAFRADGKEGNLNLYTLWESSPHSDSPSHLVV
jgi:SAM-dependent methyltransferase